MPGSSSRHPAPPADTHPDTEAASFDGVGSEPRRPFPPIPLVQRLGGMVERFAPTPGRLVGAIVGVAVAVAVAVWLLRPPPPPVETSLPTVPPATPSGPGAGAPPAAGTTDPGAVGVESGATAEPIEAVVHAAGAVATPGLYRLPADARVADVVAAAGGLAADADGDRLNLAAPVVDGMRVYVPRVGEAVVPPVVTGGDPSPPDVTDGDAAAGGTSAGPEALVDVNTASAAELEELPGVGPATAEAIIDHREEQGPFRSVDDLIDVRGIGDAKLADLRDRVRV